MAHLPVRLLQLSLILSPLVFTAACRPQPRNATTPASTSSPPASPSSAQRSSDEIALLEASIKGDTAAVQTLLSKGVNANTRDADGRTPLTEACYYQHTEIVKLLIGKGADVWAKKNDGQTPVTIAAAHPEIAQLLKRNLDLIEAARAGNNASVNSLLNDGAYINAKDSDGRSALTEAAWENHADTVKLLLEKGADPNMRKNDGTSPLSIASGRGYKEIEELLKKAGAN